MVKKILVVLIISLILITSCSNSDKNTENDVDEKSTSQITDALKISEIQESTSPIQVGLTKFYTKDMKGNSVPVTNKTYERGLPVFYELQNIGPFNKTAQGSYDVEVSVTVKNESGSIVYQDQKQVSNLKEGIITEFTASMETDFKKHKEGEYIIAINFTDKVSGLSTIKSETFVLSWVIWLKECEEKTGNMPVSDVTKKEQCYCDNAIEFEEVLLCVKYHSFYITEGCVKQVDKNKNKPLINLGRVCGGIYGSEHMQSCYDSMAGWRNEITFCNKTNKFYKGGCAVARDPDKNKPLKELVAVCDSERDRMFRYDCYMTISIHRNSRELCEQIPEGSTRNTCMQKT